MAKPVLIFDLDDTLYPELEYIRTGFRAVAEKLEREVGLRAADTGAELERLFWKGPPIGVFDRWLEERGLASSQVGLASHVRVVPSQDASSQVRIASPELRQLMISTYREQQPSLHLFCDARWVLDRLAPGWRLALLTDGRSFSQRHKIKALGLEATFEAVVVSDEIEISYRKPSVQGFELLLRQLAVEPGRTVYLGDNPLKDFLGPKRLGMATVRVRRRCGVHGTAEPPGPEYAADREISSLFELPELLPTLISGASSRAGLGG